MYDEITTNELQYEIKLQMREAFVDSYMKASRVQYIAAFDIANGRYDSVVRDVQRGRLSPQDTESIIARAVEYQVLTLQYATLLVNRLTGLQ